MSSERFEFSPLILDLPYSIRICSKIVLIPTFDNLYHPLVTAAKVPPPNCGEDGELSHQNLLNTNPKTAKAAGFKIQAQELPVAETMCKTSHFIQD